MRDQEEDALLDFHVHKSNEIDFFCTYFRSSTTNTKVVVKKGIPETVRLLFETDNTHAMSIFFVSFGSMWKPAQSSTRKP